MGGNLFKLGRMPRDRYLEVEADVVARLEALAGPEAFRIPRYYGDKPDFGDLDVVICSDGLPMPWGDFRAALPSALGLDEYRSVGPLFTTVYRGLQVDYFPRRRETFLSTWSFLCYNDVGNLLGKIAHRLGMKYGEEGLLWVHRGVHAHKKTEILLTRDYRRIFALLDLDVAAWEAGFPTLESLFRWVVASRYFSVQPWAEPSASTRKLLKDRRTIREFVAWLDREKVQKAYAYEADRSKYLPFAAAAFPEADLERKVAEVRAEERLRIAESEKFNGRIVMEVVPRLEGRALGEFMSRFRRHRPDLEEVLRRSSPEDVRAMIAEFHRSPEGDLSGRSP